MTSRLSWFAFFFAEWELDFVFVNCLTLISIWNFELFFYLKAKSNSQKSMGIGISTISTIFLLSSKSPLRLYITYIISIILVCYYLSKIEITRGMRHLIMLYCSLSSCL